MNGAEVDLEAAYSKLNLSLDVIGVYELSGEPLIAINYALKDGGNVELLFYEHNNNFYAVKENGASVGLIGTKYLEPVLELISSLEKPA